MQGYKIPARELTFVVECDNMIVEQKTEVSRMSDCVLALYDCRSKQEYIYRTNRMIEISGGSALLTELFGKFFNNQENFRTDWRSNINVSGDFVGEFENSGLDGELLYDGGGNLFVIYRNREVYLETNKRLSRYAIDKTYSVSIVASCVPVTGNFNADRSRLYAENTTQKNQGSFLVPNNVLPFTQIDRLTYMPIVEKAKKDKNDDKDKKDEKREYTMESRLKFKKGSLRGGQTDLGNMIVFDKKSILAVIYIDGNNMGAKLKNVTKNINSYAEGVSELRQFSVDTNTTFVDTPIERIEEFLLQKYNEADKNEKNKYLYRKVISGGDEITLVCNARLVPDILRIYFNALGESTENNSACAGVALFHSHAPFSEVYKIAEECCESGKDVAHLPGNADNSYIDFHFCHSGITNDLKTLRKEQGILTQPYQVGADWEEFLELAERIRPIGRSNIKDLGLAVFRGESQYRHKLEFVHSRYPKVEIPSVPQLDGFEKTMRMIADISAVYDLWFAGGED